MTNDAQEKPKPESIRSWWTKKTRRVTRALVVASVVSFVGSLIFFKLAPPETVARLQVFNGAMTLPLGGALWLAAFIFQFLIPSREVAFRSQETLERTETRIQESVNGLENFLKNDATPALETFKKLLATFEATYFKNIQDTIYVCQYAAKHAVETADRTEKRVREIHQDAAPVIEAAGRILGQIEKSIQQGILEEIHTAATATSTLGPVKGGATTPNLSRALESLRKRPVSPLSSAKKAIAPVAVTQPPAEDPKAAPLQLRPSDANIVLPAAPRPRINAVPLSDASPVAERSLA